MTKVAPLDRPECVSIVPARVSNKGASGRPVSHTDHSQRNSGLHVPDSSSEVPPVKQWSSERRSSTATAEQVGHRVSIVQNAQHHVRWFYMRAGWYESPRAVSIRKFIRSKAFQTVSMIALFVALFGADISLVAQVPTNTALDIILTITFMIFLFEFCGLTLTDITYILSFFFWMDLLGTVSIVLDLSYTKLGADAGSPERLSGTGPSTDHVIIVRAARAAKLGARAGRLSRVLKLLKFVNSFQKQESKENQIKVAKIISNQLTNVLSTRVSFLTICVVLVLPLFSLFTYPEMDESMSAWTKLLATTAGPYCGAVDQAARDLARVKLDKELRRFALFYDALSYGPFEVCCGTPHGDSFNCNATKLQTRLQHSKFREPPNRRSSIRYVSYNGFQSFFDLQTPRQYEAVASIGLICFVIVAMCCFSMVISSNIGVVVLQPLERMLSVVRSHCLQIFKYTNDLGQDESTLEEPNGGEFDGTEQSSEFDILEKVIGKLAVIADISTQKQVETGENMTENDIMVMNWMQGVQTTHRSRNQFDKEFAEEVVDHEPHSTNISATRMRGVPADAIDALDTWDLNSLDMTTEEMVATATCIIYHRAIGQWTRNHVQEVQVFRLITNLSTKYMPNPFHNFSHAVDVVYTVARFLELISACNFMQESTPFWMTIAACGHDAGHIGVNNQYLIETSHALAVKYNDRSPLENLHCATLFQVLSDEEANVFSRTDRNLYKDIRHGMIEAILHTDVTKHNEMIKELNLLYQMNSEAFDEDPDMLGDAACSLLQSQVNMQLTTNALLHTADVNNPMKPWDLAHRIAYLCIDEFFAQGDLEKAAGLPVQMLNDREKVNRPNSQVGFIEFFIAPMTEPILSIFPQLGDLAEHLGENINNWFNLWVEQFSPSPEAIGKVSGRVQKVSEKLLKLAGQD